MLAGVGTGAIGSATELSTSRAAEAAKAAGKPAGAVEVTRVDRIHQAYCRQLDADMLAVVKDVNALAERIRSQWAAHADTAGFMQQLNGVMSEPNLSMTKGCRKLRASKDPNAAERLIRVFREIEKFGNRMDSAIAAVSLDKKAAGTANETAASPAEIESARKTARMIARTAVRRLLLLWIDRRSTAVRDYEAVLLAFTNDPVAGGT